MKARGLTLLMAALFTAACAGDSVDPIGGDLAEDPARDPPVLDCSASSKNVFDGGPGPDGIPALANPDVAPAGTIGFLNDRDRVLGLEVNGAARAYPLSILWWHEVINDTLGGQPVVVTYCPLTGSGLAFDPRVFGGVKHFGVSGLLFENNLIMFDRETRSHWNQLLRGAQCGPAAGTDLPQLPVVESNWGEWRARNPQGTVVTTNTGHDRPYGEYPYGDYAELRNATTLFPSSAWSSRFQPKELVLGVTEGDVDKAYSLLQLQSRGRAVALNDTLGGRPLVVVYSQSGESARAYDRQIDGQTLTFSVADSSTMTLRDDETGSHWDALGRGLTGVMAGKRLTPLADAYTLFWFAWSVYHPATRHL